MTDPHKDREGVEECINNLFNTQRWAVMLERYTHEYEEPTLSEMIEDIAHDVRTLLRSHEEKVRADLIALVEGRGVESDYKRIALLISSIFYYGGFKAETPNERELQALLEKVNLWPTNEALIVARRAALKDTLSASGERHLSNKE